ncbi:MAG: AI-2E family transporter [Desulfovibrio sp.]|nr:AI-2E family transporter [Desulfovibrio sp.]MCA1985300.1 AI-2E family transporter [Desulfovibrio sp.]
MTTDATTPAQPAEQSAPAESRQSPAPCEVHASQGWLQLFFHRGIRPFLLLVLCYALYMAYGVLEPFLTQLILATVMAGLFSPVQEFLSTRFKGRRSLASLCVVLLICLVIILPLYLVTASMVQQGLDSSVKVKEWVDQGGLDAYTAGDWKARWQAWVTEHVPYVNLKEIDLEGNLLTIFRTASERFLSQGANLISNAAGLLSNFFITMFLVFYLSRDGVTLIKKIKALSPLREEQEDRIIARVRAVARSVLLGSLATAVLQGIAGGIGFAIVGIPAVFWGVMLGFASFIPVVGTALIWIPAVAYLALMGSWGMAIFLAIWCALVVGSIDNFARPYLMQGEAEMSPFYIFLALLGGFQTYGIRGLLYGPLVLGFAMVMLSIYEEEFREQLPVHAAPPPDAPASCEQAPSCGATSSPS